MSKQKSNPTPDKGKGLNPTPPPKQGTEKLGAVPPPPPKITKK